MPALVVVLLGWSLADARTSPGVKDRSPSLMLGLEAGVTHALAPDRSSITASAEPGGSLDLALLWRTVDWVAVGLGLGFAGLPVKASDADTAWVTSALILSRFLLPVGRVDVWAELGVGFGALTQTVRFINARRITMLGPGLAGGLGLDVFVHRRLSLGAAFRVLRIFPGQYCLDAECTPPGQGLDPGLLWRTVVTLTYHFPLRKRTGVPPKPTPVAPVSGAW